MARPQDNHDDEDLNNDDNPDSNDARETPSSTSGPSPSLPASPASITCIHLTEPPQVVNNLLLPLPRLDASYPLQDADSPPATDVVHNFNAAAIRLLEHFSQVTSQSARKRESWTRIAHLVEEGESHKAAALAAATVTNDNRNSNNDRDNNNDCNWSSTVMTH
ncbi:hypothetical protein EDB85DRAFT_2153345 [Lactarius pseudohatsudake]|nr:hypothetical protein EDB85DRAFT_2153345 [Lactarius pseudohatsudake]